MTEKANILLIGCGGVGTMTAYNLEAGGLAQVTAVLRSNYDSVVENGFVIKSIDHGDVQGWRPNRTIKSIPTIDTTTSTPFDYIILTTKNIPDVPPNLVKLITPAVTPSHTSIFLLQNGLNIEQPFLTAFPTNPIISGVSLIGATETKPGHILHDDRDRLIIGAFSSTLHSPATKAQSLASAQRFVDLYSASKKVHVEHNADVEFVRWRKLVYNSSYNSACAIVGLDTARMRVFEFPIEYVVRPLMLEIVEVARKKGVALGDDIVDYMIHVDPTDTYFKPSMLQDVEKGNYIEFENIVGEPLREAEKLGVPAPSLRMAYGLLKCLQWKVKEQRGLVQV